MPRDDDDEIVRMIKVDPPTFVRRIKVDPPTFDGVHDPKVFSDWLTNMDYYFYWYRISEERKVWLARIRLLQGM